MLLKSFMPMAPMISAVVLGRFETGVGAGDGAGLGGGEEDGGALLRAAKVPCASWPILARNALQL